MTRRASRGTSSAPPSHRRASGRANEARRVRAGACVLVSGGLDSIVLLRESLRRHRVVQPLYVRAGLRWESLERARLRRLLRRLASPGLLPLRTIEVPMTDLYRGHWSTSGRGAPGYDDGDASVYIPGRNISLFAKAATFCALRGIPILVSGILDSNPFPDGSPAFLRAMERALGRGLGARFRIETPFRRLAKHRVIRMGRDLPLHLTFSCISPRRGLHCGDCCKCKERIDAFLLAGVADGTPYAGGPGAAASSSGRASSSRPASSRLASSRRPSSPGRGIAIGSVVG
jgi:7-cyano-7-deazaguanine synthase